LTKEQ